VYTVDLWINHHGEVVKIRDVSAETPCLKFLNRFVSDVETIYLALCFVNVKMIIKYMNFEIHVGEIHVVRSYS
jgi:hypothetical protein